jgi:tetratricopeptide (TPR) repeat protein
MGEHEIAEDQPYTHSEIQMIVTRASLRNKAIILLMSSAGLRVGAIPSLRIKDIEPIDKYNIYKINVYAKSKKSAYFSFCTPECRNVIDNYLDWRKRFGERLKDDAPLFRKDFNVNGERVPYPQPLGIQALECLNMATQKINDKILWNDKGVALDELGKHHDAILAYDKALRIDPNFDITLNNKGLSLYKLGKYQEAINCFDRILILNPNVKHVLINKTKHLTNWVKP